MGHPDVRGMWGYPCGSTLSLDAQRGGGEQTRSVVPVYRGRAFWLGK